MLSDLRLRQQKRVLYTWPRMKAAASAVWPFSREALEHLVGSFSFCVHMLHGHYTDFRRMRKM